MNKKSILIGITSLLVLSLTSCDMLMDFINIANPSKDNSSTFSEAVASSKQSIVDISTPPADDLPANRASKNYSDFVENNAYPLSCTPSIGEAKLLVIPVWFNDSSKFIKEANKDNVKEDIHAAYFGEESEVGWQSVKSYYETESLGALTLTGTVSDWYEADANYSYYGSDPSNDTTGVPKTIDLVEKATSWYFANHSSESKSDYDCDNDGYLDGVFAI